MFAVGSFGRSGTILFVEIPIVVSGVMASQSYTGYQPPLRTTSPRLAGRLKRRYKRNIWPQPIVMTTREAFNVNPKVELALYSSQIDLNLAVYHQFGPDGRGHARGSGRGQISNFPVTTRHKHRIEFCNLFQP